MAATPSKRFVVFLCLIVLHQDLVIARTYTNEIFVITSSQFRNGKDADDFGNSLALIEANDNHTISSSDPLERSKRLVGTLIFVISMVVTVTATTIETIYDISGCCGIGISYLCTFESNFKRAKDGLQRRGEKIDQRLKAAITKRDNLECLAKVLETLWSEIEKVVIQQQKFLNLIHPRFEEAIMRKERAIKNKIKDNKGDLNQLTIDELISKMSETDLAVQLSAQWSSAAIPGIGALASYAIKTYKVNRVYKTLKATQLEPLLKASPKAQKFLGFSDDAAKVFIKNTALARFGSKSATLMKGLKFLKVAGNVVSVLGIAVDVFNIINTYVGCGQKETEARNSMARLDEVRTNITKTENCIKQFENLTKIYLEDKLLADVQNPKLHIAMESIRNTTSNLPEGQRTWSSTNCADSIIPDTLKLFKTSKDYVLIKDEMISMIDNCVATLRFSYECVNVRLVVKNYIIEGCKNGNAEFDELYSQVKFQQRTIISKCQKNGEPYTPKEDYRKTLEEFSAQRNFSIPCRLNSEAFKDDVCAKYNNGKTVKEIAQMTKMSGPNIEIVVGTCKLKGEDYLSPAEISDICDYKAYCDEPKEIVEGILEVYGKKISIEKIKKFPCSGADYSKCRQGLYTA